MRIGKINFPISRLPVSFGGGSTRFPIISWALYAPIRRPLERKLRGWLGRICASFDCGFIIWKYDPFVNKYG